MSSFASSSPDQSPEPEQLSPARRIASLIASKDILRDPAQQDAIEALDALWHDLQKIKSKGFNKGFVSLFKKPPALRGLYIWGGVGRGKTMLMDVFYKSLPAEIPSQRWHFHAFMLHVHDYLHQLQKTGEARAMDDALIACARHMASGVKVICFDEMVVRDVVDAMLLSRLFSTIMSMGTVIVFTSNTPPAQLYEGGWQRERFLPFIDLIEQKMNVIEMNGVRDFRLRNVDEQVLYYAPITAQNALVMREAFLDLCDNHEAPPFTLLVKGHKVDIPHASGRCAWFHFNDLCAKPLAAVDYLAICAHFDTIFINEIPVMSDVMRNEAKRFIALVDALYDTRRRVVIAAFAQPGGLYKGTDHAFEFDRAISRLKEMRTKVYWNAAG